MRGQSGGGKRLAEGNPRQDNTVFCILRVECEKSVNSSRGERNNVRLGGKGA